MSERAVVITGVGVLCSAGIGKAAFWQGLLRGEEAISDISLFDTSALRCHKAGEISAFEPEPFLGRRGLKYLDRSTQLTGVATALALDDAGIAGETTRELGVGLVLGTSFGSLDSISRFDQDAYREGPRSVKPMDFPKTVINSPAGHTAIRFGLSGLNATITTGVVSSLQAIKYAADCINMNQADVLLAGGVEELCLASYLGFDKLNILSGTRRGTPERAAPFDQLRNGLVLGEGAALFVLESREHAIARRAHIYADIGGFGCAHDAYHTHHYNLDGGAALRAMEQALSESAVDPLSIDYIGASANGSRVGDRMEAQAIKTLLRGDATQVAIQSIKSMVGESLGASGALQVACGLLALGEGLIPPTVNYETPETGYELQGVTNQAVKRDVSSVMVNSFGCDGNNASLLLHQR